jgi:hypothetical protein
VSLYRRYEIAGSRPGPRLPILAGVHGDECEPMVAVDVLRRRLAPMEIAGSVVLIPIANESAYRRDGRTGDDELDLARTFPGKREGTLTERERAGRVFKLPRPGTDNKVTDPVEASKAIGRIGRVAGIVDDIDPHAGKQRHLGLHDLRRTFGERWSRLLMAHDLKELMRHEAIATTEHCIG